MSEKVGEEIISPEGVEERIVVSGLFRVTLTGGGKYRVYGSQANGEVLSIVVCDTEIEARRIMGSLMLLCGALAVDSNKTIDVLTKALERGK